MLKRTPSPSRVEKDWFNFCVPLSLVLGQDYLALRLLFYLEPLSTLIPTLGKMLDVAEKSLKLFVTASRQSTTALSSAREEYGHNIEKLRRDAANFSSVFNDPEIVAFTNDLSDKSGKLYQSIRYGSEITTEGFSAKIAPLLPVIDKIFFESLISLPDHTRRILVSASPVKSLLCASPFDQTRNRGLLLAALRSSNAQIESFSNLCAQLDAEHKEMLTKHARESPGQQT